jgi:phage terminase large subunit
MSLKDKDPYLYDIFVLGKKGRSRENIYPEWVRLQERPERFKEFAYGLDFGYQHPTALIKIWYHEDERYIEEVIYQSHLTSHDLVTLMNELEVSKDVPIAADHARPEMIQDLIRSGFAVYKADKSVKKGIDMVRRSIVYVDAKASNVIKENANYKHKKINGLLMDNEVIKLHDDAMDAIRYGNTFISTFFA